ncbi:NADP oxidoreductase [Micromonospora globispora]|uniref:NADPH-dependent F420 reductase n=1 Tax=Micromonospora globispora TaxID=1450148 RepID=UPI000D6FF574|nr:NAD(P)-binding domain-containing protein [Micromonospora globispora]PWU61736.1 NADP oxidoreductase [Micromonospora globispora]
MKIAVLGTGMVGQALAGRLAELGHEVTVGTRDVAATLARTTPDGMGNPPYAAWAADHPQVRLAPFADAAAGAELLVNATSGDVSIAALQAAGTENLTGKILIDIANPLDFSNGFPPTLFVKDTDSLGEQIQAAFPQLRVVKALNTLTAALMVHPKALADGDHSIFVSGNDAEAKKTVTGILESFGHTDVIDLGDITTARGTEMLLPVWLRLMGALNTPMFNFKIVR